MARVAGPRDIKLRPDQGLTITWDDNTTSDYSAFDLRLHCPCAMCVNEWTGERTVDAAQIATDIHPRHMELVGRYALKITWSDNHDTGIYSWDLLHKLAARQPAS